MELSEKELLLKDLSARLPYGVICHIECEITLDSKINAISVPPFNYPYKADVHTGTCGLSWEHIQLAKPYLRPMTSMTDEEREEYQKFLFPCPDYDGKIVVGVYHRDLDKVYDWLNAHHFDYRGLIERGLAIRVTPDNNPYE
jgi:hypothetical protein